MPNKVKIGRVVEYMEQNYGRGRKFTVNCKIIVEDQPDNAPKTSETSGRSLSRGN